MAQVTLYGSPISTYVRTARIALAEKGVGYDLKDVWVDSPEIKQRHPFQKIPVLRHGDFELYETFAVSRYIDEAFPGPALQPSDAKARARMTQWISVHNSYCYPTLIGGIVLERVAPKLLNRPSDEAKIKATLPDAQQRLDVLEKALGTTPYLAWH
jgi:glutathione S-transferase